MANFELPDRVRVDFWIGPLQFTVLLHFVPTGEDSCRLESMVTNPMHGLRRVKLSRKEAGVPRQDRLLIEGAEPAYQATDGSFENSVPSDAPTLLARRIIDLAAAGLWQEKRRSLPERKLIRARM